MKVLHHTLHSKLKPVMKSEWSLLYITANKYENSGSRGAKTPSFFIIFHLRFLPANALRRFVHEMNKTIIQCSLNLLKYLSPHSTYSGSSIVEPQTAYIW